LYKIRKNYRGTCGFTHWQKNPYPDLQRSVAAGELDPRVMLFAGIPMGIPAGYLCGPAPMSSLKPVWIHELRQQNGSV